MGVPIGYRAFFTVFDIVLPIFGTYAHIFKPAIVLGGAVTRFALPPATETVVLLDTLAGCFASLAVTQTYFLITRPHDVPVWKGLNVGTFVLDLFQLASFYRALAAEGRLDTSLWRGEDYGNVVGYTVIALVRAAFIAGIGVDSTGSSAAAIKKAK